MKVSVLCILIAILSSCAVKSVKGESMSGKSEMKFDQKLADSLGADARGMRTYMLVILKTGPQDAVITDKKQREELFKGHFSNMGEMEKSGKLKMAGPFATKNSLGYRGIFLLDVKTEAEAKEILQNDPTVKAGIFNFEILPWYGSAALPMHLQYHKKISKETP